MKPEISETLPGAVQRRLRRLGWRTDPELPGDEGEVSPTAGDGAPAVPDAGPEMLRGQGALYMGQSPKRGKS
jgi:hypothetical protein